MNTWLWETRCRARMAWRILNGDPLQETEHFPRCGKKHRESDAEFDADRRREFDR